MNYIDHLKSQTQKLGIKHRRKSFKSEKKVAFEVLRNEHRTTAVC